MSGSRDFNLYVKKEVIEDTLKQLPKAQYWLDSQIWEDMKPYMPMETGAFQNLVGLRNASLAGTGQVCVYAGPSGRFLYYGKKMKNAKTGKGPRPIPIGGGIVIFRWPYLSRLIATEEPLTYSNPMAQPEWDEVAKRDHFTEWQEGVRKILNGR